MFTNTSLIKEEEKNFFRTEFGTFEIDYSERLNLLGTPSHLNIVDLLIMLYQYHFEISESYIEKIKEVFSDRKNFIKFRNEDLKALCYYYNKFKLYEDNVMISNLFYSTFFIKKDDEIKEMRSVFSNVSYNTFLYTLKENLNHKFNLPRMILFFPKVYFEKKDTLEILATTKFTFKTLNIFDEVNLFFDKSNIEKTFSFISTLPKEKVVKYIKPNESEVFINVIAEFINNSYFDDAIFASLFIPFRTILENKVPLHIKKLLIDDIGRKYKGLCLDIFENELSSLTNEEIVKLFSYSTKSKISEYLRKLYKCNHSIFNDKNIIIILIKEGYNILNYLDIENLSHNDFEFLKEYFNLDLESDAVRVKLHPNINNKYKFEYGKNETIPNGYNKEAYLSLKLSNKYDQFLFQFLISGSDIELIYDNYYEQYKKLMVKKYGEEKFLQIDTIYHFLRFILVEKKVNNEIVMPNLETIYKKLNLNNVKIEHLRNLMCTVDPKYTDKINNFLEKQRKKALAIYNTIINLHLNGEKMENILVKLGYNKESLISEIVKMRNLYKEEKRTIISVLIKEHYILTVGDIIGIIEEMEESELTLDGVIRFNGINKTYIYESFRKIIYSDFELHDKIKNSLFNNKKRGFKKYIKLAYYITTFDFNDEEDFKNMFPEFDLDEMIENAEKLDKRNLVNRLKKLKSNIKPKIKQIS